MEGRSRTTARWVSPLSPTVESSTRTRKKSESCGSTEFRQCLVAVPGGGDPPRVVVEAQLVHCSFELLIATRARRYPSAESLVVEQRPGLRIVVGHSEQHPLELFNEAGRCRRCDGEVAVVERLCACDHADAGGFEQPLRLEELFIRHEKTSCVNLSGYESTCCVALSSDMVSVFASEDVEDPNREVIVWMQAGCTERSEGQKRCLWRVRRTDRNRPAFQIGRMIDLTIGQGDDHRTQIAVRVAHGDCPNRKSRCGCEPPGANPRQRRVPRHVNLAIDQRLDQPLVV